jgi:hypothetical protein
VSDLRLLELTFDERMVAGGGPRMLQSMKLDGRELDAVERLQINLVPTGEELYMVLLLDPEGGRRAVEELSGKTILVSINDGEAFEIGLRVEARYCRQGIGL